MMLTKCSTKVPFQISAPSSNSEMQAVNFTLNVVINKEKNKVLFAEVDSDFTDVLLSFLTLPLGTIVRLLDNHFTDQAPVTIGSLNTLYRGLSNLETTHFCSNTGKHILVNARNSLAFLCKKLKLNLNDSGEPTKYFSCGTAPSTYVIMNKDTYKCNGGKSFDREVIVESSRIQNADKEGGVFVNEKGSFLITDDLRIVDNSVGSCMKILNDLGVGELDGLEQGTFVAGFKEIVELLKCSLVSQTPLSDLILRKRRMVPFNVVSQLLQTGEDVGAKKIMINAIIRKSTNKVLLVEADQDFVNLLFSLLVIPLGRVVHLLGINTSIGSVDSLYRSVMSLESGKYLKNEDLKSILLEPQLPPDYLSTNQIFSHFIEEIIPLMPYPVSKVAFVDDNGKLGYVKGPAMFMVTDDLVVTPFSAVSSLYFLSNLKVPVSDVDERKFEIGMEEALNILKASLTSTSALTDGLKLILKKQVKQEK